MADTEFGALAPTSIMDFADQSLIVRGGIPYRFVGPSPVIDAAGNYQWRLPGAGAPRWHFSGVSDNPVMQAYRYTGGGELYYGMQLRLGLGEFVVSTSNGAAIGNHAWQDRLRIEQAGAVRPGADGSQTLGAAGFRWSTIYASTGAINTSDEREKREIGNIPDAWLDAWGEVDWCRFKFHGGDRWHVGLVAQRVHAAFAAHELDAFEIGLCCFDKWEAQREPLINKDGSASKRPRVTIEAGDRWGLRYDECFAIEAAWQRRELRRLETALAALRG